MADTQVKKGFWKAIRAGLRWVFHIVLIPFVAILKGLVELFQYLHDELARF